LVLVLAFIHWYIVFPWELRIYEFLGLSMQHCPLLGPSPNAQIPNPSPLLSLYICPIANYRVAILITGPTNEGEIMCSDLTRNRTDCLYFDAERMYDNITRRSKTGIEKLKGGGTERRTAAEPKRSISIKENCFFIPLLFLLLPLVTFSILPPNFSSEFLLFVAIEDIGDDVSDGEGGEGDE
jgi:hypothetical protein